jgi:glucose-1-phosphate cytidylyltransferase
VKVVLFCGGRGMRLRDYSETIPKPMVNIGFRPILWHVMKYYAHFGYKDFILCLGYKADVVKSYFRNYDESVSNDFILDGNELTLLNSDIHDWKISLIDTGINANVGQRLKAVEPLLEGEDAFLANYTDGLTDLDLNAYVDDALGTGKTASFLCVRPTQTFHVVSVRDGGTVSNIAPVTQSDVWINSGFFVLRPEIFEVIHQGEDLVVEPFHRLIEQEQLYAHKYTGFWTAMDTFRDKDRLDQMYASGDAPWELWRQDRVLRPGP